jgi:hypothetical protein
MYLGGKLIMSEFTYTQEELRRMHDTAVKLGLSGSELLTVPEAQQWCNGIGAQWMWSVLRDFISDFNPAFLVPSAIHDVRYETGGNDTDREFADNEWLANCLVCVNDRYGWYNPLRYYARKQARKYYALLRISGGLAWEGGA